MGRPRGVWSSMPRWGSGADDPRGLQGRGRCCRKRLSRHGLLNVSKKWGVPRKSSPKEDGMRKCPSVSPHSDKVRVD